MRQRSPRPLLGAFFVLAFGLLSAIAGAESFTGKCVGVTDGDTITVMRDGKGVKVRLYGIDTPESGQPFGNNAKQYTSLKCFSREVTIDVRDVDRYGRTVGMVILEDGSNLNQELVAKGFAWWYRDYAKGDTVLQAAEAQARSMRAGLWADKAPVAPWEWRRGVREGTESLGAVDDADARSRRAMDQADAARERNAAERAAIPLQVAEAPSYEAQAAAGGPAQAATAGQTVFKTNSGKKYHAAGCRYLLSSQIPLDLAAAVGMGLTPCSACNPPIATGVPIAPRAPVRPVEPRAYTPANGLPAAMQVEAEPQPEQPSIPVGIIVYGTNSGKKYHNEGCRYLAKSQIAMGLADARAAGLEPCSVCNPPQVQYPAAAPAEEMGFTEQAPAAQYAAPQADAGAGSETVYLTRTGAKYHRGGCRYLAKSQIPTTKAEAQAQGYGACSVCRP